MAHGVAGLHALFFLTVFHLCISRAAAQGIPSRNTCVDRMNRSSFPPGFIFGAGSSSYQYEGAAKEGGRGPGMWDTYTHLHSESIKDGSNGDVAIDFYHRYKEDVKIMKDMGMDGFRFSISWPRILPNGNLGGGVNKEGIQYYNKLIDELLSNGVKPFATLFHWDTPQSIEDSYQGFLSSKVVDDFRDFADVCFKEFGNRVKHWITLNEPWTYSVGGYGVGFLAPGRCSPGLGSLNCSAGNSGTEPYIVGHNLLLAHAAAVKLYRDKYQASQQGVIGVSMASTWMIPFSMSTANTDATQRALDFNIGWFMQAVTYGDYPESMKSILGNRLLKFTENQSEMLKRSFDFIGVNYYTSNYAADVPYSNKNLPPTYNTDSRTNLTTERGGIPIGRQAASHWLYVYPPGIRDVLVYMKERYNSPVIYITENGMDESSNATLTLEEALNDEMRIDYHREHLSFILQAIRKDGVDVKGYFAWSLFDNFEWANGFTLRFGFNYVDFENGLKRYPKRSAIWFRNFLRGYNTSRGTGQTSEFEEKWNPHWPQGIRDVLVYVKNRYSNPVIYVTQNGVDEFNNDTIKLEEALQDDLRIDFYHRHLLLLQQAIREGVDVRGYFAWAVMDNFQWADGYSVRFGLVHVDYRNDLKRHLKKSSV